MEIADSWKLKYLNDKEASNYMTKSLRKKNFYPIVFTRTFSPSLTTFLPLSHSFAPPTNVDMEGGFSLCPLPPLILALF